jgi:hypothetical protein
MVVGWIDPHHTWGQHTGRPLLLHALVHQHHPLMMLLHQMGRRWRPVEVLMAAAAAAVEHCGWVLMLFDAEARDAGVGVTRFPGVHPLSYPPPRSQGEMWLLGLLLLRWSVLVPGEKLWGRLSLNQTVIVAAVGEVEFKWLDGAILVWVLLLLLVINVQWLLLASAVALSSGAGQKKHEFSCVS